jgi:hypothetical protein
VIAFVMQRLRCRRLRHHFESYPPTLVTLEPFGQVTAISKCRWCNTYECR